MSDLKYGNVNPIHSKDCHTKNSVPIPDFVYEIINEWLTIYIDDDGTAKIWLSKISNEIEKVIPEYDARWLDIEPHYRKYGWEVKYVDKFKFEKCYFIFKRIKPQNISSDNSHVDR